MGQANKYFGEDLLEISVSDWVITNSDGVQIFLDALESENLSQTASETKVRGGIKNQVIYTIPGEEEVTLELVSVKNDINLSNAKWGAIEKTGVIKKFVHPKNYVLASEKTITLPQTPNDEDEIVVYLNNKPLEKTTGYTISGTTLTIVQAEAKEGDSVFVSAYSYMGQVRDVYYEVGGDGSSALVFSILQKKPIFDTNLKIVKYKYRYFPKATLSKETSEEGQTSRENQTQTYTFSIEKHPNHSSLFYTYYVDAEDEDK